jgi:uncharacterized membrane protein YuzA (DUF378 family)
MISQFYLKEDSMEVLITICYILTFIGAINWGLVGLFKFDLVAKIVGKKFGEVTSLSRIVYVLVLIGGVVALIHYFP